MINWLKNNWLIIGVLLIAFLLRFIPLFEYEFFFDELSALDRIRFANFGDLINKGVKIDVHPALIQVFLFYWAKIGGTSEVWIKLPFLLCGFLSCWFIFRFANKWFDYKTGVISAIVVSCSMIFLVYSSSNHLYATAVLFSILSIRYLFEIIFGKSIRFKDYFLFGAFVLLGALNHHMGALLGLLTGMLGVIFSSKKQRLFLLITALGIILFYLPHLPVTLTQIGYSIGPDQGGWLTPPKWYACFSFLKTLFGTGILIYLFLLLFIYVGVKNKFSFLADKKIIFLLGTFVTYCLVVQLYSVLKTPILQFSVLLIAAPCFVIVVARGLSFIPDKMFSAVCVYLVAGFLIQTIFIKKYYSLGIKQSTKSAITQTIAAKNKYGATNVAAIYNTEPFFAKRYVDEFKQHFEYLTSADSVYNKQVLLGRYLKALKENYIILSEPDPILLERTKCCFPFVIYHQEGYFENIFLLSKLKDASMRDETIIHTYTKSTSLNPFHFPEKYPMEHTDILIDSTNEFPFYVWADFNSLHLRDGQVVMCSTIFKPYNCMADLTFDFSIQKNDTALFYTNRNFKDYYLIEDTLQQAFSYIYIGTEINEWKDSKLGCYFWNSGKKRYVIKDFRLQILDCNPHKYTLWD